MGKGGSSGKVNIPEYKEPVPYAFRTPYGNVSFANDAYSFDGGGTDASEMMALRNSIMKTIGVTGADREKSLQTWKDTFFNESKRLALPQAEQTLFDRGLGGSKFYQDQTNDLLTKLATQSILNAEDLRNQDENQKLANLSGIDNIIGNDRNYIMNLLGLSQNDAASRNNLATSRYQETLPYAVTYDQGKSGKGQLIGGILGAAAGTFMGNPMLGYQLGSSLGGAYDASKGRTSTDYGLGNMMGGSSQGQLGNLLNIISPKKTTSGAFTTGRSYTNAGGGFGGGSSIFGGPYVFSMN